MREKIGMGWFILFIVLLFTYPPLAIIILLGGIAYSVFVKKKKQEETEITIQQKIDMACSYAGISKAELSRRLGSNINAFSQRLKTGKFSDKDFQEISKALGAEYYSCFRFPDGKEIQTSQNFL